MVSFTEWTFFLVCLYLTKISLHYGTERLLKKVICIHQNYVIQHCIVSIVEIPWTKNYFNFFPKFFIAQSAEQAKCNLKWWDTAMRKCLPFSLAERRKGLFTFWYQNLFWFCNLNFFFFFRMFGCLEISSSQRTIWPLYWSIPSPCFHSGEFVYILEICVNIFWNKNVFNIHFIGQW